jgi:hypothetical protein
MVNRNLTNSGGLWAFRGRQTVRRRYHWPPTRAPELSVAGLNTLRRQRLRLPSLRHRFEVAEMLCNDFEHTCSCRRRDRQLSSFRSDTGGRGGVCEPLCDRRHTALGLSPSVNLGRQGRRQSMPEVRLRPGLLRLAPPLRLCLIRYSSCIAFIHENRSSHSNGSMNGSTPSVNWLGKLGVSSQIAFAAVVSVVRAPPIERAGRVG